ncbi:MAG: alpha/beta fold hydrolase [Pirellulales bacterium]|nr:alpha/beta fold hydrolase [Pirellulales bacterium]
MKSLPAMLVVLLFATAAVTAEPKGCDYPDHSNLLVVRDADGKERPVKTTEDWAVRRRHILDGMQDVMGPLPDRSKRPPLDIQTSETLETPSYTRKTITFVPEPGDRLSAYLYIPIGVEKKHSRSAVVALHPTQRELGKKVVDGQSTRPNRAYARELAQRGYVVIAPDYVNMGDYKFDFRKSGYESATMKAILNHMRCIDLLESLDEVDSERIAAIGHSLGGHNAIFLGVFDPRVKVVVSSCGWTPFHDYYGGKIAGWSHDGYMPRLKTHYNLNPDRVPFDFYELVAALAPRPFMTNSPLHDDNFDYRGVKKAIAKAAEIYKLYGAEELIQARYPDAEHDFPTPVREESYRFIDRALKHKPNK